MQNKTLPPLVLPTRPVSTSTCDESLFHHDAKENVVALSPCSSPISSTATVCAASPSFKTASSATTEDKRLPERRLSTLRLLVAHIGAAMTLFLATTDATIVSTALPTIASDLQASQMQYIWVGVAYMLTQTAFQPLYGRISDLVGRKSVLYSSMAIFSLGSVLCGAAQSIEWLIAARALAGIGGGGIVSAVWVITSEIVEEQHRPKWSQALSITWSCSAIAGPLLGGVFSNERGNGLLSWRWGFYINLPICFVAFVVLLISLNHVTLTKSADASWRTLVNKFDFGGLFLFMSGSSCVVIGFSFATEIGWTSPRTLVVIVLGILLFLAAGFHERSTTRESLFPRTTFHDMTTVVILAISFLHNLAFNAGTFYLALFYQAANGSSPLEAGIKLLPYSLGSSLASMPVAWFIGYWQRRSHNTSGQNMAISAGLLISTLGFGLLNLLDEHASLTSQIIYPLIAGIGLGMLFHAPYQVFTKAVKPSELATGTSAFFLIRFTGATVGLAVAGAIFYARSSANLPSGLPLQGPSKTIDYTALSSLQPEELKQSVLHIISSSIQTIWTVCAPCLGFSFLISFLLRKMKIKESEEYLSDTTSSVTTPEKV